MSQLVLVSAKSIAQLALEPLDGLPSEVNRNGVDVEVVPEIKHDKINRRECEFLNGL